MTNPRKSKICKEFICKILPHFVKVQTFNYFYTQLVCSSNKQFVTVDILLCLPVLFITIKQTKARRAGSPPMRAPLPADVVHL